MVLDYLKLRWLEIWWPHNCRLRKYYHHMIEWLSEECLRLKIQPTQPMRTKPICIRSSKRSKIGHCNKYMWFTKLLDAIKNQQDANMNASLRTRNVRYEIWCTISIQRNLPHKNHGYRETAKCSTSTWCQQAMRWWKPNSNAIHPWEWTRHAVPGWSCCWIRTTWQLQSVGSSTFNSTVDVH